jgi:chemotaxis protein histidine kinase CheA
VDDHGIVALEARLSAGKPVAACLTFRARAEPNAVHIELADDGAGIDWKKFEQAKTEPSAVA